MAKKEKTLEDLFHDTLKDIYYAEKKILTRPSEDGEGGPIPRIEGRVREARRRDRGSGRTARTGLRADRETAGGKTCVAIDGIIDEGKEVMQEYKGTPALDAGLLAAAQAVEHYEISRYGTLKTWAEHLGLREAVSLLDETLEEEKNTDQR